MHSGCPSISRPGDSWRSSPCSKSRPGQLFFLTVKKNRLQTKTWKIWYGFKMLSLRNGWKLYLSWKDMKGIYNLNHELKYSEHQKSWKSHIWLCIDLCTLVCWKETFGKKWTLNILQASISARIFRKSAASFFFFSPGFFSKKTSRICCSCKKAPTMYCGFATNNRWNLQLRFLAGNHDKSSKTDRIRGIQVLCRVKTNKNVTCVTKTWKTHYNLDAINKS